MLSLRSSFQLSSAPTPEDIYRARFFLEPLVPIGAEPTPAENIALAIALMDYSERSCPDDFSSLIRFLETHPLSAWNAALLTNLGLEYYNTGQYSKTLEAWGQAWQFAKAATDLKGKALADRAVGELAYMYARLGRISELDALLKSVEERTFIGPATERITGAREGLINMKNHPEISFRCGPLALHRIKLAVHPHDPQSEMVDSTESTLRGFSLLQVAELSRKLGLDYQMAFRTRGSEFIVPSVVHFKVDHFAALIRRDGDHYLLQDPTFKNDAWVTREALEAEASGYFLIPSGDIGKDWRVVEAKEAEAIWGKGNVPDPGPPPGPCDHSSDPCNPCPEKGMAVARVHLLNISLNISDEPVGYSPPVGPAVRFTVRYNQRDDQFSSNFNYSNFGPKWTFDWLSYIKDSPSQPLADVTYYIMGGGNRIFTGFDQPSQTYAFQVLDQTKLIRTSANSYEMISRDGSRKIFGKSDEGIATRRCFLTQIIDPMGNKVTLTYDDDNMRIVAITDAIGQVTKLEYGNAADIFKITKVTDPFGRSATFEYNLSNQLVKITDVIGLASEFGYESTASDFITSLTTPYGVTNFTKELKAEAHNGPWRSLEILYPNGERERVEFNQNPSPNPKLGIPSSDPPQSIPRGMAVRNEFLAFRNTYHWDRQGCAYAYGDYSKARIYHWLHSTDLRSPVGILESTKKPLEGRVWYDYLGQGSSPNSPITVGSTSKPAHVGRVLDDGSTQLYTYEYNGFGNVTKMIDPMGRTFSYIYAENGIDLLETRQTRAGQNELLSKRTYNALHLPLTSTDAAGQTTTYTYNARGQLITETNARGDTTTYNYDINGYRTSVVGPIGDTTTWTYDAMGRIRTKTDASGYILTFDYDPLDRITKITYSDATFDQFGYTKMDFTLSRDRAGRQTVMEYNNVRQMIKRTDPLNRVTLFEWCKCGALRRLTDPMGRTTTWRHDVQGRVKCKEYADGSKITYLYETTSSRLRHRIDEKLQVTQYNYNRDDSLSRKSYTNTAIATPSVAFAYDANYSRLRSMTDGTGTTRYDYIPISAAPSLGAGQLARVDGPLSNDTITFGYDELGRRISTAINGVASSVTYDAAGRIITSTNALGVFTNTYDGNSFRKASQTFPNGQTTEYGYADNLHGLHLQRITNKLGATPISEFIYDHDISTGPITSWSQQAGTQTPSIYGLVYDPVDQLTAASVSEGGKVVKTFGYSYDPAGNRLTEQVDVTTRQFFYNALNELTSIEGDAGLDATYQWDTEHRLISATTGNQITEFTYDGLGRRVGIRFLVNGAEASNRRFVWCDNEICEERTSAGLVSKRYYPQGMKIESGATAGAYFYSHDHLGSIRELTDSVGTVRARYSYDPFGQQMRLIGDIDADFGFAYMFWSPEASVNLTWFRAYDPDIGRWLSRDPLENAELVEGSNLYGYVHNNPVNQFDPLGLALGWGEGDTRSQAFFAARASCEEACPPGSKVEHRPKNNAIFSHPSSTGRRAWSCSVACTCLIPPAPPGPPGPPPPVC
jgi:RHS repeat-associated protein